ncbi:MAG: metallophosphoesterase [bacterium]
MSKKTKYCPFCKKHKPISKFAKEGKGRLDKNGEPRRRRMCGHCRWIRRKEKNELEKQSIHERKRAVINALIQIGRHDIRRIKSISEDFFSNTTNAHDLLNQLDFNELKKQALDELMKMGYRRPNKKEMKPGNYLIVGDSHGSHTNNSLFELLHYINEELDIENIIHVGHLLDDDNYFNSNWIQFDNLIILSKIEELQIIEEQLDDRDESDLFEIIREEITIGDYKVFNQDMIRDYVKTFIGNLDPEIFPGKNIVNSHRHEMDIRCSYMDRSVIMSPGCLCNRHIIKTIKQIDFTTGNHSVKVAYHDGFVKYRRMAHMNKYWQHGAIMVHYDGENTSVVPMRIKKIDNEYVTSYFDKIITNNGVEQPDKKIFVNGDVHVDYHDDDVLYIQEQICKDYEPDIFVTLGDTYNCSSLNHHRLDRKEVIKDADILKEMSDLNYILERMGKWAKEKYIFFGNHERFLTDFTDKFPQLENLLDYSFLANVEDLGYELIDHKEVLEIGSMKFIHGDMVMYGGKGKRMERASRVFKECIMGHIHYPSSRFNCYTVGLSGIMDHDYNEPNASNWTHSFILCNQFKGVNFVTPVIISDHRVLINNREYWSFGSNFSDYDNVKVKLVYEFNS